MVELFSTMAVAMAGLSMGLTISSALANRRGATPSPVKPPSTKSKIVPPTLVPIHQPVSLKFSALELRAHARSLGLRNARWRNSAKKDDLVLAIRVANLPGWLRWFSSFGLGRGNGYAAS